MAITVGQDYVDYLAISLCISSDRLTPDEITKAVEIEPSYVRERGTPTRNGLMRQPELDGHEWQIREQLDVQLGANVGDHAAQFISAFLAKVKDAAPKLKELSEEHDVLILLVYLVHQMPYIGLTKDQLQTIASLGARLDYDIMV